jgi:hypothetical protein
VSVKKSKLALINVLALSTKTGSLPGRWVLIILGKQLAFILPSNYGAARFGFDNRNR